MCKVTITMYKYQIAEKIGCCTATLRNWMNGRYYEELQKVGYTKTQKYLTAKQINRLNEILDFLD